MTGSTLVSLIADFTAADPERAVLSAEEARLVRDAAARLAPHCARSSVVTSASTAINPPSRQWLSTWV